MGFADGFGEAVGLGDAVGEIDPDGAAGADGAADPDVAAVAVGDPLAPAVGLSEPKGWPVAGTDDPSRLVVGDPTAMGADDPDGPGSLVGEVLLEQPAIASTMVIAVVTRRRAPSVITLIGPPCSAQGNEPERTAQSAGHWQVPWAGSEGGTEESPKGNAAPAAQGRHVRVRSPGRRSAAPG